MTEPYTHTDSDGCALKVHEAEFSPGLVLIARDQSDENEVFVHVKAEDLDVLVAAMYAAADRQVVILPAKNLGNVTRRSHSEAIPGARGHHPVWSVELADDGRVHVLVHRPLGPGTARDFAATVVAFAVKSEALVGEAEIGELADHLQTWAEQDVEIRDGDGRDLARLLLAAGYRKAAPNG